MADGSRPLELTVDGQPVSVIDDGGSLLDALRWQLGVMSPKDGCSPQGQCGCCTVLVDGQARVACVTPVRRAAGRSVTTVDGLDPTWRQRWADGFCSSGGSQCGFCTPGIIVRLEALRRKNLGEPEAGDLPRDAIDRALAAHLCRCTGWQTIVETVETVSGGVVVETVSDRDLAAASVRAELEGGAAQVVDPDVALGRGGFAADTAPDGALLAVRAADDTWVVGETMAEARAAAAKVQGRRTTAVHRWPLTVPAGDWDASLRTTWVEPAYLETDASWCEPGGEPASMLANGGAFGSKVTSPVGGIARELADRHGRAVLVLASREDTVRWGPKRPPVAGGARADGSGVLRVVDTPGVVERIAAVAPGLDVERVRVPGPPTSASIRGAGWVEAVVLLAGATGVVSPVTSPSGGTAEATISDGRIDVTVRGGRPLDPVTLRSYCIGAAHMAWSWLTSESITVDEEGTALDLTVRSFGVVRAADTPRINVELVDDGREPVNGSDAVFAAVAAAGWLAAGCAQDWPVGDIIVPT